MSELKNSDILGQGSYYHEMDEQKKGAAPTQFSENYEEYIRILEKERQREMVSLTESHR